MFKLSLWNLKRILGNISTNLSSIHRNQPEVSMGPILSGTGWTYQEWAFFYAAKPFVSLKVGDEELGRLVKVAGSDFRDFLLAIAVRIDAETRKAIFLSPDDFHGILRAIAEVVLERIPAEFKADDWIGSRYTMGATKFAQLHLIR